MLTLAVLHRRGWRGKAQSLQRHCKKNVMLCKTMELIQMVYLVIKLRSQEDIVIEALKVTRNVKKK